MKELSNLTYGIIGLGIMGGSIARAIRSNVLEGGKIFAMDKNQISLAAATDANVIDKGFSPEETCDMLKSCDFVFVCLYPHATVDFLRAHKSDFKDGAIITDISGVKGLLESDFKEICPENACLILGHPMAGGEKEGFLAAKGEYFINHNYIIIEENGLETPECRRLRPESEKLFEDLIYKMGFKKITKVNSQVHDNKIGFTSQLCHVVASAMVESAEDPSITSFGGGSFEDLTRIAMINAPLWTELFLSNKEKLLAHIATFKKHITEIETLIAAGDAEGLQDLLQDVRKKRIEMQRN